MRLGLISNWLRTERALVSIICVYNKVDYQTPISLHWWPSMEISYGKVRSYGKVSYGKVSYGKVSKVSYGKVSKVSKVSYGKVMSRLTDSFKANT